MFGTGERGFSAAGGIGLPGVEVGGNGAQSWCGCRSPRRPLHPQLLPKVLIDQASWSIGGSCCSPRPSLHPLLLPRVLIDQPTPIHRASLSRIIVDLGECCRLCCLLHPQLLPKVLLLCQSICRHQLVSRTWSIGVCAAAIVALYIPFFFQGGAIVLIDQRT